MASMSRPRRRSTAQLTNLRREHLTNELLGLFADDPRFVTDLKSVASEYSRVLLALSYRPTHLPLGNVWYHRDWYELEHQAQYDECATVKQLVSAIKSLVRAWNLHTLPVDVGYVAVTSALFYQACEPDSDVILSVGFGYEIPRVEGQDWSDERRPLTVTFHGRWYPEHETPGDAIERLQEEFATFVRTEIASGLDRLEAAGYAYDDAYMTGVYLEWLFRRIAFRDPVEDIAHDVNAKPTTVETKTKELARFIGIGRIPDNRHSRRGQR